MGTLNAFLPLPILLMAIIASATPQSFVHLSNITSSTALSAPALALGLSAAYEYTIGSANTSAVVWRVYNYTNTTSASNAFGAIYSAFHNDSMYAPVSNSSIQSSFNFSPSLGVSNYAGFSSNGTSTVIILAKNSLLTISNTTNFNPPKSLANVTNSTTPVVKIPQSQIGYLPIIGGVVIVAAVAALTFLYLRKKKANTVVV